MPGIWGYGEFSVDNIVAYAIFDLPVMVLAKQLRRFAGFRHRQADQVATGLVLGGLTAAVLWACWSYGGR